jgi:hypothetical protein
MGGVWERRKVMGGRSEGRRWVGYGWVERGGGDRWVERGGR